MRRVMVLATNASCRSLLEEFAEDFKRQHSTAQYKKKCAYSTSGVSTTALFKHFEECSAVTQDNKLLGDALSNKLRKRDPNFRLPSSGSFAAIYQHMSSQVHSSANLIRNRVGDVVVPCDLPSAEKRFWIRFLIAMGHSVVVYDDMLEKTRPPLDEEQQTPPKAESQPRKRKVASSTSPPAKKKKRKDKKKS